MPSSAWIALLLGAGAFVVAIEELIRRSGGLTAGDPPDGWGGDEAQRWDAAATAARADFGLKAIRDVAKTWSASIATLLGVLSTVAIVKGPDSLVDVGGTEADIAAWLILLAAGVAAVAVTLAILAEQGVPQWEGDLDGWAFRSLTRQRAKQAAGYIQISRYMVVGALLLIVLAAGVSWLAALTGGGKSGQNAIVSRAAGVTCGTLTSTNGTLALKVGNKVQPIAEKADVTLVDSCP